MSILGWGQDDGRHGFSCMMGLNGTAVFFYGYKGHEQQNLQWWWLSKKWSLAIVMSGLKDSIFRMQYFIYRVSTALCSRSCWWFLTFLAGSSTAPPHRIPTFIHLKSKYLNPDHSYSHPVFNLETNTVSIEKSSRRLKSCHNGHQQSSIQPWSNNTDISKKIIASTNEFLWPEKHRSLHPSTLPTQNTQSQTAKHLIRPKHIHRNSSPRSIHTQSRTN